MARRWDRCRAATGQEEGDEMQQQMIECALTVKGPVDHTGDYIAGIVIGSVLALAVMAALIGWVVTVRNEGHKRVLEQQNQHMRDELLRLRKQAGQEEG